MSLGRKVYLWLGLAVGPLAVLGLRAVTKITKAPRVRIIVESESGKILLLKNVIALNDQWTLPGGGVARAEPVEVAARRELREETGIVIPLESFQLITTLHKSQSGLPYDAPIVQAECASLNLPATPINTKEIAEIGWFDPKNLPVQTAELVHLALKSYKKRQG